LIIQARARGVAVVFITHNAHHALAVGDHYAVLIRGSVTTDFRKGEKTRE
jgi:simple sugar transport system ATP-binding protein